MLAHMLHYNCAALAAHDCLHARTHRRPSPMVFKGPYNKGGAGGYKRILCMHAGRPQDLDPSENTTYSSPSDGDYYI